MSSRRYTTLVSRIGQFAACSLSCRMSGVSAARSTLVATMISGFASDACSFSGMRSIAFTSGRNSVLPASTKTDSAADCATIRAGTHRG